MGYNTTSLNPGPSGPNVSWDFSAISPTNTVTLKGVAPSTLPNGSLFANANVAMTSGGQGNEYYTITDKLWERQGVEAGGTMIQYSDAETFLIFPLSYNTTNTDSFIATYKVGAYSAIRKGAMNLKADAYGTLILPNKTYTNVLRVVFVEEATDYLMGSPFFVNKTTGYQYYVYGTHYPLLSINTSVSSGKLTYSYSYVISNPTGLDNYELASSSFEIYPNPAKDALNLNFLAQENTHYSVNISNTLGLVVKEFETEKVASGQVTKNVSLDGLSKGIYFVTIRINDEQFSKKVVVE